MQRTRRHAAGLSEGPQAPEGVAVGHTGFAGNLGDAGTQAACSSAQGKGQSGQTAWSGRLESYQ